jgi:hypothetical protein
MSMRLSPGMSTPMMRGIIWLTLTLFVPGIGADHPDHTLAPDDPAMLAQSFD